MFLCYSSEYSSSVALRFTNFQQREWKKYECIVHNKQDGSVLVKQLNIVVVRKLASSTFTRSLQQTITRLRFDCNSTALRPFDDRPKLRQ